MENKSTKISNGSQSAMAFSSVLRSLGQEHLIQHWSSLTESQRDSLQAQISSMMPLDQVCKDFQV